MSVSDRSLACFAFDLSATSWEKGLRSGCIATSALFYFVYVVWPSAFGTEGGTWWTRLHSMFDDAGWLLAVIAAPSLLVFLLACLLPPASGRLPRLHPGRRTGC